MVGFVCLIWFSFDFSSPQISLYSKMWSHLNRVFQLGISSAELSVSPVAKSRDQ